MHVTTQLICFLHRSRQRKTSSSENASGAAKAGDKASKWKMQSAQLRVAMKASQGDSLAVAALTAEANRVRSYEEHQCNAKCI